SRCRIRITAPWGAHFAQSPADRRRAGIRQQYRKCGRTYLLGKLTGESAQAEASWRRILGLGRPERFASLDMGIYGHLTRRNLAVLAEERADRPEAARLWHAVLAECPRDPDAVWAVQRLDGPVEADQVRWLIPGSRRRVVPV